MIEINGKITKRVVKPAPLLSLLPPDVTVKAVTIRAAENNLRPVVLESKQAPLLTLHPGESVTIYNPELYSFTGERRDNDVVLEYTREVSG